MAERAAAVRGSFSAAAGPDGGFEVRARLPITGPDRADAGQAGPDQAEEDGAGSGQALPGRGVPGQDAGCGTAPVAPADLAR